MANSLVVLHHPTDCPSPLYAALHVTRHETLSGSNNVFPAEGRGTLGSEAGMMRPSLESLLIALRGRPTTGRPSEALSTTPINCSHACSRGTGRAAVSKVHPSTSGGGLAVRSDTDAGWSLVLARSMARAAPCRTHSRSATRTFPLNATACARVPSSCPGCYLVKLRHRSCAQLGGLVPLGSERDRRRGGTTGIGFEAALARLACRGFWRFRTVTPTNRSVYCRIERKLLGGSPPLRCGAFAGRTGLCSLRLAPRRRFWHNGRYGSTAGPRMFLNGTVLRLERVP